MPPDGDIAEIDTSNLPDRWITTPDQSRALDLDEMTNNACMFTMYYALDRYTDLGVPKSGGSVEGLGEAGKAVREWTPEAVAGILGNMTMESTINPSRWQNDTPPSNTEIGTEDLGYGLVQWTPYSKYRDWAVTGYHQSEYGVWQNNGYLETERIAYERKEQIQWIATDNYNFSFQDFTKMEETPSYMADAFLTDYERPADPDASRAARQAWAEYWYKRVTLPIYGYSTAPIWYWLFPYIYNRNYLRRWVT